MRLVIIVTILLLLLAQAEAQSPAPATPPTAAVKEQPVGIAPDVHARLERLLLQRQVFGLQLDGLEKDYRAKARELDDKRREVEAAIADEAGKVKLDPKLFRPDLATKTWRKVQP